MIPIDIALIPPKEILELAVSLNERLSNRDRILGFENYLPHISLLMGNIKEENLNSFFSDLNNTLNEYNPLDLSIIELGETRTGVKILKLLEDSNLLLLQQRIQNDLINKVNDSTILENLFEFEKFSDQKDMLDYTKEYVDNFEENIKLKGFRSHISIGRGQLENIENTFPINFTVSRIAICHLGINCTCGKIIYEQNL